MFRYVKKSYFVWIFSHFSKKIFNKKLFLLKYLIHLEKIYKNRVTTYFNKGAFLPKFIFLRNFVFEKRGRILTEQFFFNVSKQVGENLIVPSGWGYHVTSRKFFKLGTWKSFLKSYEQKFLKFSNFSIIILH